ncbi:MAG: hypothetical protein P4L76_01125 [Beijerinckiaceae bacterium]|nr:hypothetical protein [Beijerinckiaceae bacterium]
MKKVEEHGDVAPPHVHDPKTMVMRHLAIHANLMRWDDERGHYVLTGTGRSRIAARGRDHGAVLRFRKREDRAENITKRKAEES